MLLIEKAERETLGEQPPIVLIWADYRKLVAERDEARRVAREYLADLKAELIASRFEKHYGSDAVDHPWLENE